MRRSLAVASLVATLVSAGFALPARADGGMCAPGRMANTGDRIEYVADHCGPPTYASTTYGTYRRSVTRIDEWTYDLGPGSFPRVLLFHNGVLISIREVSR
jgi:hypothetical protein